LILLVYFIGNNQSFEKELDFQIPLLDWWY